MIKKFIQYFVILTVIFSFSGQCNAGLFVPALKEVLWMSVSGYINVDYSATDAKYTSKQYAQQLDKTLSKEIKLATRDCRNNRNVINYENGYLSGSVKEIYDSLKIQGKFDDYRIISALLLKYAYNSDDIYFHADYR